jgi:hypothetical protein
MRLLVWICVAAVYWVFLFMLTHLPGRALGYLLNRMPIGIHAAAAANDKVQHAIAFFGLGVILCGAYEAWRPNREWGYLGVFLAIAVYGGLDEFTQGFVGSRQSDFRDWLADLGGAALGVGLMFLVASFWRARSSAASADVSTR